MGVPLVFGCILAVTAAVIGYVVYQQATQMNYNSHSAPPPRREPPPRYEPYESFTDSAPRNRSRSRRRRHQGENEKSCIICFEQMNDVDTVFTKCAHVFHKKCIEKWTTINKNCPLCRDPLV